MSQVSRARNFFLGHHLLLGQMVAAMKQRLDSNAVVLDRVSYTRDIAETELRLQRERQREDDLRYRENELLNMLVTEQGRWIELSSRLDDVERALTSAR
jgi:hypothetical protein